MTSYKSLLRAHSTKKNNRLRSLEKYDKPRFFQRNGDQRAKELVSPLQLGLFRLDPLKHWYMVSGKVVGPNEILFGI